MHFFCASFQILFPVQLVVVGGVTGCGATHFWSFSSQVYPVLHWDDLQVCDVASKMVPVGHAVHY